MTNHKLRYGLGAVAIASLASFASCAGELEEQAFGELTTDSGFGGTDDEFLTVLIGGYTDLYGILGGHNSYWSLQEVSTDEAVIPTRGADWGDGGQWTRVHTHEYNSGEESINNAWVKLYGSIATANRLLEVLPTLNEERAATFAPEIRGLRALYYWYLLDLFGNVPIIDRFVGGEANPTTQPREQVYNFVVNELTEIIPLLPENHTYARVSRPVAQAILSKVYLNAEVYVGQDRYAEAMQLADSVINSGEYSLESDYFANFNVDNAGSSENIFVIPYDEIFGTGFNLGAMTLHYGSQGTFDAGIQPWNGYATLADFYDTYSDDDRRKGEFGNQNVRGNFLAGPQFTDSGEPVIDPSADDPGGRELVFTPEINELAPGAYRQAGARIGKFEFANGFLAELSNDFPILRLADIMLVKAECILRTGGDEGEALELVNMVRDRAFEDDPDGNDLGELDDLDLETLYAERGREMFAEGYRRQDMIRFGTYNDAWTFKPASDQSKNLMPIPAAQLQANPNLQQNPGY